MLFEMEVKMDNTWVIELGFDARALTEKERAELLEVICVTCGASFARTVGFSGPDRSEKED
jgi:hypothetical protein